MLEIALDKLEFYDGERNEFINLKPMVVRMEHSLISISKFESITHTAFLPSIHHPGMNGIGDELIYISCMIIGSVPSQIPFVLHRSYSEIIRDYIANPHTATTFHNRLSSGKPRKTITSELIYFWMIEYNIPLECEQWHLNRLLTLIDVCNTKKNTKDNKMTPREAMEYKMALNEARKKGQSK